MVQGDPHICWTPRPVTSLIISDRGSLARLNQDHLGEFLKNVVAQGLPQDQVNKKPWRSGLGIYVCFCFFKITSLGWFSSAAVLRATDLCPWEDLFLQDLELAHSPQPQREREGTLAPSLFHSNPHTEQVYWLPGCLGSCQSWACPLRPGPWNRRHESVHRQWHSGCQLPGTFCGLIFLSRR